MAIWHKEAKRTGVQSKLYPEPRVLKSKSRKNTWWQPFVPLAYLRTTSRLMFCITPLLFLTLLTNSPLMRIRGISVEGLHGLTASEVSRTNQVAKVQDGSNLVRTNLEDISRNLAKLPWIKSAKSIKTITGHVVIKVVPLVPVAHLRFPSGDFEVDQNRIAIRPYNSNRTLPEINSAIDPIVTSGKNVELTGLSSGILIWKKYSTFGPVKITKIYVDAEHNLCLNMSDTVLVHLGTERDIVEKLDKLRSIYALRPDISADLQSIVLKSSSSISGEPRIGGKIGARNSNSSLNSSPTSQSTTND